MGTHGVFTYKTARAMGILSPELARWVKSGRIVKVGHGVYRLTSYPLQGVVSELVVLLAEVGEGSYLYGETALGFLELCPTRSYIAFIATPNRCRRKLAEAIRVVRGSKDYRPMYEQGIPCQRVEDAIVSSIGIVESSRLYEAVERAIEKGYLTEAEGTKLLERMSNGRSTKE